MPSLDFVNLHGQPVATTAPAATPKKRAATAALQQHKGWRVLGYSPAQLRAAEDALAPAMRDKPFDAETYMLQHRPKPVRSKPYELHSAALHCAELARRDGWLGVRVVAVVRGGAQ